MKILSIFCLIALCSIVLVHSKDSNECTTDLIYSQDCSWYQKCLESNYNCGPKGYPIGYGYKYCTKFLNLQQKATPIVKNWIQSTLICLKHSLIKYVEQSETIDTYDQTKICHLIKKDAFSSHPKCYTQSGFCSMWKQLGVKGSAQFIEQLYGIFELKDFLDYQAIKQIFTTVQICAKKLQ